MDYAHQGIRDTLDLLFSKIGVERQRERAARDVLADGEFALAIAEPLAVERHQVDRRQVWLRLDPLAAETLDRRVAVDLARELDDVDEPRPLVAARIGRGQLE